MTPIQRASLPHTLGNRDVLGTAITGSGKTLAFLIPIIEKLFRERWSKFDGLGALVLVPTHELAMQILKVLQQIGQFHHFSAGVVVGGHDFNEEQTFISKMNILIGTPGRILKHLETTPDFNTDNLQILCIDEADRVLDMGFKKELMNIIQILPKNRQTLLFSATLNKTLQNLARLSLKNPQYINTVLKQNGKGFNAPKSLTQYYIECNYEDKLDVLFSFIKSHTKEKCIIFFSSCKQVRFVYETFRRLKLNVSLLELHGRQKQNKRTAIFFTFFEQQAGYLLSTDMTSRGFDFPQVDWVFQVDCPEDYSQYIHRIGRTARFQSAGKSLLLLTPQEQYFLQYLKEQHVHKLVLNQRKQMTIKRGLQGLLAERQELKYLAERAFTSYLRGIWLMPDKNVFNIKNIDTQQLASSFGLSSIPKIKYVSLDQEDKNHTNNKVSKLQKLKQKIEQKKKDKITKQTEELTEKEEREKIEEEEEEEEKEEEEEETEAFLKIKRKINPIEQQSNGESDQQIQALLQQQNQQMEYQDPYQIQQNLSYKKESEKLIEKKRVSTMKFARKMKRRIKFSKLKEYSE